MAHNLRNEEIDGEKYINVNDLFKMMYDVMTMEGLHPEAVKALDGFGTGLALTLNVIKIEDLSEDIQEKILKGKVHDNGSRTL